MNIREGINKITLNHKSYTIVHKSGNQDSFIVRNEDRKVSALNIDGEILKEYKFDFEVLSIDFDTERKLLFILDEKGLHVYGDEKKELKSYQGNYKSVFVQAGKIWCLRAEGKKKSILEIYDLGNYLLLDSLEIEDIFFPSYYMIVEGFDEKSIILWSAGGQDGQVNYLVKQADAGLKVEEIGEFDTYPVRVSPDKKSFINFRRDFLKIYSYLNFKLRKTVKIDSDKNLETIIYVDDNQILLQFSDKLTIYNMRFGTLTDVNIFKTHNEIYSYRDFRCIEKVGNQLIIPYLNNEILLIDTENLVVRNENQLEFKF